MAALVRPPAAAKPKPRQANPLKPGLEDLGWSGAEFGRRLGVHKNTVTWWFANPAKVPRYAIAYLEVCVAIKRIADLITSTGRRSKL